MGVDGVSRGAELLLADSEDIQSQRPTLES